MANICYGYIYIMSPFTGYSWLITKRFSSYFDNLHGDCMYMYASSVDTHSEALLKRYNPQ